MGVITQPRSHAGLIVEFPNVSRNETKLRTTPSEVFVKQAVHDYRLTHYISANGIALPRTYPASTVSPLIQAANDAYDAHMPFSLRPEVLWYAIVHEVAIYVKQHHSECAKYFTTDPDHKITLEVRDDSLRYGEANDWHRAIGLFNGALRSKISPEIVDLFLPNLSTMGAVEETAVLVSFMDVVGQYYEYAMITVCGFPQILLAGSAEDWSTVRDRVNVLVPMFSGLGQYFQDLTPVLDQIAETALTGAVDERFWTSIFKVDDESGGPYINGWLTALTAYAKGSNGSFSLRKRFDWRGTNEGNFEGLKTSDFPPHVSKVPFKWEYLDRNYEMELVAGILGVEEKDGFLTPGLGFCVVEI